jgi:hypothetical protein
MVNATDNTTSHNAYLIQTQTFDNLALNEDIQQCNLEESIEYCGRHFLVDSLLKLGPQTRYRYKQGGFGTIQVMHKGGKRFSKKRV